MANESDSEFDGFSEVDELESFRRLSNLRNNDESDISLSDSEFSDDDIPLARLIGTINYSDSESSSDGEEEVGGEWTQNLHSFNLTDFDGNPGPVNILDAEKSELDFFNLIFTPTLIQKIADETNRYAQQQQQVKPDGKWRNVTAKEIRAYLGFQIVMGIIQAPELDMYWCTDSMFSPTGINEIITRDRYDKISQYFHVADNSRNPARGQPGHDKLSQVRPILESVRAHLKENYRPHREVSIDEAMIGYTGRLGFKQYVPLKPTKRGIKVWVRADPHNGYINDFQVYCGKEGNRVEEGLGERVVVELSRDIWNKGHHIYCDNYFTSVPLFNRLLENGTHACGTFRVHRRGIPAEVKHAKLKNQGDSKILQKGHMVATAWRDKRTVYILSTNFNPTRMTSVLRRQKDGSQKEVQCPEVVRSYTQHMNGVDRADQLRAMYAIGRKASKWWKYLFWFLVDISVVGAFILMKESPNHQKTTRSGRPKPLTQLNFRMNLAKLLIGDYSQKRKRQALKENQLADGSNCWIKDLGKKRTCKQCSKHGIRREPKYGCEACEVNLCRDCFKPYHMEKFPGKYTK